MNLIQAHFLLWFVLIIFGGEFHLLIILMLVDFILAVFDILSDKISVTFFLVLANYILQLLFSIGLEKTLRKHEIVINCNSDGIEMDSEYFQL
jgi:hypothetical protein